MTEPRVSITIPCHHRPWQLERCLKSLAETDYDNLEIICVVDGDSPESVPLAPGKVFADGVHRGIARSVGVGWNASDGDILMEVDQDILFLDPSWLKRLVWSLQDFPFLGVVALPICPAYDDRKVYASDRVKVRRVRRFGLNGAGLAVRRDVFERLGYPWQGPQPAGGHDFEYTWRARWCGFRTGYLQTADRMAKQMTDAPEDREYRKRVERSKRRNTRAMRERIRKIQDGADHFVPYQG